jgi:PKD repeat protein
MSALLAAWGQSLLASLVSVLVGLGATPPAPAPVEVTPALPIEVASAVTASAALSDSASVDAAAPVTVTADPLPTVQINGVAWAQVVVGNKVFVAGKFTSARPAGARAGTSETPRSNLLAYDIRTGQLITSWAPTINAQAVGLAASPDGTRLYVGGDFTQANGENRYRVAAFDTTTGALISNFRPAVDAQVRAIAATDTTVYLGGRFSAIGSVVRDKLAAVRVSDGALLPWAPKPGVGPTSGNRLPNNPTQNAQTSSDVMSMVLAGPNQVVVSGRFDSLNGTKATGVGALDASTGATRPFAVNAKITNQGVNSAIYSLSTDGTNVYGTGYDYYGPGDLEGTFAAAANGGAVRWFADCRGDTYSVFPMNGAVYTASHAHDCRNMGSFAEVSPIDYWHANAFSVTPAGVSTAANNWNGGKLAGSPAPAHLAWHPMFDAGSFTGQYQAGWSVAGNPEYVVYGGEFPFVNDKAQQGLVRFALPSAAPDEVGPRLSLAGPRATAAFAPTTTMNPGAVRVSWPAVWDQDDEFLTYRVVRDGATVACETVQPSRFFSLPTYVCSDTAASAGSHTYRVVAEDAAGNTLASSTLTVTVPAASAGTAVRGYDAMVDADGAVDHWRFGEASGTTVYDYSGARNMTTSAGVTRKVQGAIVGDADPASRFNGSSTGIAATQTTQAAPKTFTVEAWFKTTTTRGGKIVGFGNARTGSSTTYDRHVYMDASGKLVFGVNNGAQRVLQTTAAFNDGRWHHVAGTLSPSGQAFYVDGVLVGSKADVIAANAYTGYWRVGGDATGVTGLNNWFSGDIDEVAVYSRALTAQELAEHHRFGSTGLAPNAAPKAAFSSTVDGLVLTVDGSSSSDAEGPLASHAWNFGDGATAAGAKASHTFAATGTYTVTLTVTDSAGATATTTTDVTVTAPPAEPEFGEVARDTFGRVTTGGWGAAEVGGAWTTTGASADAAVTDGSGRLNAAPGGTSAATLPISVRDTSVLADVLVEKAPTGGGTYVSVAGRAVDSANRYTTQLRFSATGSVTASLTKVVAGTETVLGSSYRLAGNYTPGTVLKVRFEAEGSGTTALRAKVWAAGSAEPAGWQAQATDTTAALQKAGALRFDVYNSGTATTTQAVRLDDLQVVDLAATAPPVDTAPTAAFTSAVDGLAVAVDGSSSSDAEGPLASYAWNFGDGQTATGAKASHTFAAAGEYPVTLTVTDAAGLTGTVTRTVTVTALPEEPEQPVDEALVRDTFERIVADGWGTAERGGNWTIIGAAASPAVLDGSGRVTANAGSTRGAQLAVALGDAAVQADVVLEKAAAGGGSYVKLGTRTVGSTRYDAQLRFSSTGSMTLSLVSVVDAAETALASYRLPGTYTPGTVVTVRLETVGTGTTELRAKAWVAGTEEPKDWQVGATDSTAALQRAGNLRIALYESSTSGRAQTMRVDNVWVGAPGTAP